MPEQQSNQPEKPATPAQQKAAQAAIEAGRQMEQAKGEGDTKKAAERAEEVVNACEKYLKDKLKQASELSGASLFLDRRQSHS